MERKKAGACVGWPFTSRNVFSQEKTRTRAVGAVGNIPETLSGMSGFPVEEYEILMGKAQNLNHEAVFSTVSIPGCEQKSDGCCQGNLYGTYLNGLFESGEIVSALLQEKELSLSSSNTLELGDRVLDRENEAAIKRVIHTTADFERADTLCFSEHAVSHAVEVLKRGAVLVTDTRMAFFRVHKPALEKLRREIHCFMTDRDVCSWR